jgi:hypothetical protein
MSFISKLFGKSKVGGLNDTDSTSMNQGAEKRGLVRPKGVRRKLEKVSQNWRPRELMHS